MTPQIDHASSPRPRRRDVLAYGAGLALLPAAGWAERARAGHCHDLAIGFCDAPAGAEDAASPVVDAGRLAAGDARLARGVRLTVHGLTNDLDRLPALGVRSAELKVGFPTDGTDLPGVEFRAWSYQLLPVAQLSSPVSFTVPADRGLALALEVETFGSQRFETVLSTGREPGAPKLRAGRYLIAPGTAELRTRRFDSTRSEPMIALTVEPLA